MLLENFVKNNNLVLVTEIANKANATQFNRIKSIFKKHHAKNLATLKIDKKDPSFFKNKEFLNRFTNCDKIYPVVFLNGFFIGSLNELETMDHNGHLKVLLCNLHEDRKEKNQILTFLKSLIVFRRKVKFNRI